MKKLFTSVLFLLGAITMQAEDYTGNLNIIVPDIPLNTNQEASINVTRQDDGKYELKIEKFAFNGMPVGTIDVKDVDATEGEDGMTYLRFNGNSVILNYGEDEEGILAGQTVGIELKGMLTSVGFRANIDIMADNDGDPLAVTVNFTPDGKAAQIPNSDFEKFHTATYKNYSSTEADHWHSFTSAKASGIFAVARMQKQSEESDEVREGATGKCLKITSAIIAGNTANGTVTTGRLNAGAYTATDPKNHSYLDLSNTETDDLGDPFYTTLTTMPDAIEFYCRFKQGQEDLSSKYASMRAVITDGTYYQDPEGDTKYTNIVAVAANKTIEGTDVWQKVTAKFDYESYAENGKDPKAILVTISTNAEPGVASKDTENPDYIYIDDLSLIYNANLTSLKFKGQELFEKGKTEYTVNASGNVSIDDIEVTADGIGAYESTSLEEVEGGSKATITITSEDLKTQNVYVLNIKGATPTKIDAPKSINLKNGTKAIYNLAGQKVANMNQAGVYIIEHTDGSTVKVLKK